MGDLEFEFRTYVGSSKVRRIYLSFFWKGFREILAFIVPPAKGFKALGFLGF